MEDAAWSSWGAWVPSICILILGGVGPEVGEQEGPWELPEWHCGTVVRKEEGHLGRGQWAQTLSASDCVPELGSTSCRMARVVFTS